MRLVSALVFLLALSACDDAAQPDAGADRPQVSAEKVEAERVCAEMTGYTPESVDPAAAKRQEEYMSCVAAVIGGATPELRGRSSDAPTAP
jgi:hypothetical protein